MNGDDDQIDPAALLDRIRRLEKKCSELEWCVRNVTNNALRVHDDLLTESKCNTEQFKKIFEMLYPVAYRVFPGWRTRDAERWRYDFEKKQKFRSIIADAMKAPPPDDLPSQ